MHGLGERQHQHEQVEQECHKVAETHVTGGDPIPAIAQYDDECALDAQRHDRLDQGLQLGHVDAGAVRGGGSVADPLGLSLRRAGRADGTDRTQRALHGRGHVADTGLSALAGPTDGATETQHRDRSDDHRGQRDQQQQEVDVRHQGNSAEEHQDRRDDVEQPRGHDGA